MSGCYKAALHLISLSLLGASWRPVSGLSWGQTDVSCERIQSRLWCVSATSVRSMLATTTLSYRLNPFLNSLILLPFSSGPNSSIPCRRSASPGNAVHSTYSTVLNLLEYSTEKKIASTNRNEVCTWQPWEGLNFGEPVDYWQGLTRYLFILFKPSLSRGS